MKNSILIATTLISSTLSFSLAGGISQAQASSLVPQREGEIKLEGQGCFIGNNNPNCIDTIPLGYTVNSQSYNSGYQPSLLFSDDSSTANNYAFVIKFDVPDAGTNTEQQYWFRPVAIQMKNAKPGAITFPENGQLEVGLYTFTFLNNVYKDIELSFFDTEQSGTKILKVNNTNVNQLISAGPDSNIQTVKLKGVNSFQVQLGSLKGKFKYGDGVLLDVVTTPEPGSTASLGVLGIAGIFGWVKRKKASHLG